MADDNTKKSTPAAPGGRKLGFGAVLALLLPAVASGGAAFGGARFAAGMHAEAKPPSAPEPPGPTVVLEPFLATVPDSADKLHAVKFTLAVELKRGAKEDEFKAFVPRIRDATLTYLRGIGYDSLVRDAGVEDARKDILERLRSVGATTAEQVLITDLVTQ